MKPALVGAVLALGIVACGPPRAADAVAYEVIFQGTWTQQTHPVDYPSGVALDPNSAHFSGIIGAAHNGAYTLFHEGSVATPGLVELSHTGGHSPLDAELDAAAEAEIAGPRFGTGIFLDVNAAQTATFDASERFPLVSLVTMVAPSPDWFVGLTSVNLRPTGEWVEQVVIDAFAYDAGAFEGTTYKAPEQPTTPAGRVTKNLAPPFVVDGETPPIARITFRRK